MKTRILAVEDSRTQGEMLRYVLESHGFEARLARHGREALEALAGFSADAIITDILMPEMDGYELCRAVKATGEWKDIPVILVTSLSDPAEVIRALECGADGFIVKPYAPEALIGRVEEIIDEVRNEQKAAPVEPVEIEFQGEHFRIGSPRRKVVNILLSTYQMAVEKNQELREVQDALRGLNDSLEEKVSERTAALEQEVGERRKAEERLTEMNQALEERADQLRRLAMALSRSEQAERQRLAEVLHDHLQQLLVAARMLVGSQKERKEAPDHVEKLGRVEELLSEAIEASRSLTVELSPPVLREGGLVAALEWLGRRMEEKYGITTVAKLDKEADSCAGDTSVFLFQAARELLFNVFKHAGVTEAEIDLTASDDSLRLTVRDRGKGIDLVAQAEKSRRESDSFGLFSMAERAEVIGGRMEINSEPGRGTDVSVVVPCQPAVPAGSGREAEGEA